MEAPLKYTTVASMHPPCDTSHSQAGDLLFRGGHAHNISQRQRERDSRRRNLKQTKRTGDTQDHHCVVCLSAVKQHRGTRGRRVRAGPLPGRHQLEHLVLAHMQRANKRRDDRRNETRCSEQVFSGSALPVRASSFSLLNKQNKADSSQPCPDAVHPQHRTAA